MIDDKGGGGDDDDGEGDKDDDDNNNFQECFVSARRNDNDRLPSLFGNLRFKQTNKQTNGRSERVDHIRFQYDLQIRMLFNAEKQRAINKNTRV